MHRETLIACLPYLATIVVCVGLLRLLAGCFRPRLALAELRRLPADELGGVQSLSFVLTLPLFVMIMMFIVQLSQITIAKIVVEYAAFASARAATVWIPANLGPGYEEENQISSIVSRQELHQAGEQSDSVYDVQPGSPKFAKIHYAAAMALMPICPSRESGVPANHPGNRAAASIQAAYRAMSPGTTGNTRIPARLANKLAYALENTEIEIVVHHKEDEPPLQTVYDIGPYRDEFAPNEIGWQDQIYVTVTHQFALLPGPGRLLARRASAPPGTDAESSPGDDEVAQQISKNNGIFVYPVSAEVRVSNEGQKSVLPYIQSLPF